MQGRREKLERLGRCTLTCFLRRNEKRRYDALVKL